MIYNTRNRSNDTTECQKEKEDIFSCSCLVLPFKNYGTKLDAVNKKCESLRVLN